MARIRELIRKTRKVNETLFELCVGILMFGVVCQVILLIFFLRDYRVSLGLWLGILMALAGSVHMWWALDKALDFGDGAQKIITQHNILRYGVILVVMGFIMITGAANPLSTFLGYMGMKVSAYLQPYTHKIIIKLSNKIK